MKPTDLLSTLRNFHREKLTLRQHHVAVARQVTDYDFNNTYQYIIAREDVHLSWLEAAIAELGGTPDDVTEPDIPWIGKGKTHDFIRWVREDAEAAEAFVGRWRPRLTEVSNARHRGMMQVILGETMEQKRFFDQRIAGCEDLLGRRANGPGSPGTGDGVMPVRWLE